MAYRLVFATRASWRLSVSKPDDQRVVSHSAMCDEWSVPWFASATATA